MSLGLKRGTVVLEPHSTEWEISASEVIGKLKDILKADIVDAQHIGSTAVKNICAKPVVDIVAGVTEFNNILKHNKTLADNGIIYRREDHPGQHLYVCGDLENDIHTHYIHVVIFGQEHWNNYINMRDYLNANAEKALEYSALKNNLAEKYPGDRVAYTNGKSDFIKEILQSAAEWRINSYTIK